jgi:hypothetical protein
MELCPGEDESQLATAEVAVHDLEVVDSDLGFSFGMASMEVREAVIVEEHDDGDSKEAADRRHASIMHTASAVRAQTKHFALSPRDIVQSVNFDLKRSPAAKVMDEAIDLAIAGRSVFPDRAAFIDADTPWAGQETMQAACEGLSVVLVATDGNMCPRS